QADDLSSVPDPTASRRLGKCAAQLKCPKRNVQPVSNQRLALAMQNVREALGAAKTPTPATLSPDIFE
ncbi:MAG TPA: hypothetical protein VGP76_20135, partial [Planctomycetaceae bacterium]|nr:hypothetical protein [Planctomycetaceae bacterium]